MHARHHNLASACDPTHATTSHATDDTVTTLVCRQTVILKRHLYTLHTAVLSDGCDIQAVRLVVVLCVCDAEVAHVLKFFMPLRIRTNTNQMEAHACSAQTPRPLPPHPPAATPVYTLLPAGAAST